MILTDENIVANDMALCDRATVALLQTKTKFRQRTRQKLRANLQIEELDWLLERKAGNVVRRWKKRMDGGNGGDIRTHVAKNTENGNGVVSTKVVGRHRHRVEERGEDMDRMV